MLNPTKFVLTSSDHNHADELEIDVPIRDSGLDPRLLSNAVVIFYLADANEQGQWQPDPTNARFCGILTKPTRTLPNEDSRMLKLAFLDYTTLFLEAKPFGTSGIPRYAQTLAEAWKTIVSQTPGAEVLADRIEFRGLEAPGPVLGTAVSKRFAKLGKVPAKPRTDAWAVWQQCVGMMGLMSYMKLDQVIVTTPDAYYTHATPPRLIFGQNVLSMTETRTPFFRKGIGLTSFNPDTGRTLEAVWPPVGDPSLRKKNVQAKKVKGASKAAHVDEDREWFEYPATTDPKILTDVARRVYEERSRQEMEGTIATSEMAVHADPDGNFDFDLLTLSAGDNVRIELAQADKSMLASMVEEGQSAFAMQEYLVERGYEVDVAHLMAQNAAQLAHLNPNFYVRKVVTTGDGDAMEYQTEISYVNRILVSGDAEQTPSP